MGLFTGIEISGSGMTAQRLRLDIISNNIANEETTRSGQVDVNGKPIPYRRQFPIFASGGSFADFMAMTDGGANQSGVRVTAVKEDSSPFPMVYNPNHPDANAQGYVQMPNVNVMQEMVDMIDASRAYEANISSLNASKDMCSKALAIGK
jgi:flagellar basal-body rod protein FlgC